MATKETKKTTGRKIRRAKREDLVVSRQRPMAYIGRHTSVFWRKSWSPVRRILGKRFDIKLPDNKLGRILSKRIRGPKYFRDSWAELKKVEWPNRRDTWRMTWAVILFAVFFAMFTALADFGLSKAVEKILIK